MTATELGDPTGASSSAAQPRYRLGIDIGGTFTDIVILDDSGRLYDKKVLSSPMTTARPSSPGCANCSN